MQSYIIAIEEADSVGANTLQVCFDGKYLSNRGFSSFQLIPHSDLLDGFNGVSKSKSSAEQGRMPS